VIRLASIVVLLGSFVGLAGAALGLFNEWLRHRRSR